MRAPNMDRRPVPRDDTAIIRTISTTLCSQTRLLEGPPPAASFTGEGKQDALPSHDSVSITVQETTVGLELAPRPSPAAAAAGTETLKLGGSTLHDFGTRIRTACAGAAHIIKTYPHPTLTIPLLVFAVVLIAGQCGILAGIKSQQQQLNLLATDTVDAAARETSLILKVWSAPALALASVIRQKPQVPELLQGLQAWLPPLLDANADLAGNLSDISVRFLPWGTITGIFPYGPGDEYVLNIDTWVGDTSAGDEWAPGPFTHLETNLAAADSGSSRLIGPVRSDWLPPSQKDPELKIFTHTMNLWLPASSANETWGMDQPFMASAYPGMVLGNISQPPWQGPCGDSCAPRQQPDGTFLVFWGFITFAVPGHSVTDQLDAIGDETHDVPFDYVLAMKGLRDPDEMAIYADAATLGDGRMIIAETPGTTTRATDAWNVCQDVSVDDFRFDVQLTLVLCISPSDGYSPTWVLPARIAVVFAALILGILTFSLMVSHISHRALVRAMLPPKAVQCLSLGRTYAEPFPMVTILFTDIVSYTELSSDLAPSELVRLLDRLFSGFDDLVDKHKLYKVETIGDAFMCVGGAPTACPPCEAAKRVAQMALDMVQLTDAFETGTGHKISIRVGIHSGDVTAAVMGRKMPHWCLVGDAVNVSARMESNSRPMRIHISSDTARLLSECQEFKLEPRGTLDIKGKGPMSTFWLSAP